MNEKLYCIRCRTGYAVLGEAPPKMDETAMYRLLGESIYYPHCFVVERYYRNLLDKRFVKNPVKSILLEVVRSG